MKPRERRLVRPPGKVQRENDDGSEVFMPVTLAAFRCMMCGHEFEQPVEAGEDKERSCPKCRSNSIRQLKKKPRPKGESDAEQPR